jgi:hypothetical protein
MPRANIEQQAFTDPRFVHLGQLLKTGRYDAIGRMALVWSAATERNSYVLAEDLLNHLFDDVPGFANLIVKAQLGRKNRRGVYICGSRGRIEWLENKRRANRENGRKGGRPRKTHEEPIKIPRGLRAETAPVLPTAPTLTLVPTDESFSSPDDGRGRRDPRYGGDDFRPLWSEKMYRFKADKIADWIGQLTDHKKRPLRPGDADFDVKFEAKWQMSYDYWIDQREAHEAYYLTRRAR